MALDANHPDVFAAINEVTRSLAKRFHIPGFTQAELRQQGWIYALQALPKYDATKSAIRTFLYMCVRNGLKMLRRSLLGRAHVCSDCSDQSCVRCIRRAAASETRRSLISPADICAKEHSDEIGRKAVSRDCPETIASFNETTDAIDSGLPAALRGAYLRMVDGAPTSSYDRRLVRTAVAKILEEKESGDGAR